MGLGWWLYGSTPRADPALDPLGACAGHVRGLAHKYYIDEIYEASIIRFNAWFAWACDWLDQWVWNGAVQLVSYLMLVFSWVSRFWMNIS